MTVVEDDRVDELLTVIKKIDKRSEELGLRAFVWNIERTI
jgi:hypothetical protein